MKAAILKSIFCVSVSFLVLPALLRADPGGGSGSKSSSQTKATASFSKAVQPFVAANCVGCHNTKLKVAKLDLQNLMEDQDYTVRENSEVWKRVVKRVRSGEMPPKGSPRPKPLQQTGALKYLDAELARVSVK
ncbi:MAG: c-type cytochrome domain-containing protein [Acidobacteriota bacterium]